ncbi:MAG: EF-Tu/IF-2/RF-3 family GTPase, partial [Rhodospirillales bacterium]|nr:EF-Tu/IF-2/RF-3 family GTPase [Rhodospirillales bacterium]
AKEGWAFLEAGDRGSDMNALFETVLSSVPEPKISEEPEFRMLATTLENDPYIGRVLTGRIHSGTVKPNMEAKALGRDGARLENTRITKVLGFRGLTREPVESASAGDIVAISGFSQATVADTLCALDANDSLPSDPVDPPTLAMLFSINDSPLAGREGKKVTSRMIRTRLLAEAEGNVAIRVRETEESDRFEVAGRGELQLGVLIETMRREGFELSIARPRVLTREDPDTGELLEPFEEVVVDVDEEFSGTVVESMALRRGRLEEMRAASGGKARLRFAAPSRGLIGYHGDFMTETRGTGVMNRIFLDYEPQAGSIPGRRNGVLVSTTDGKSVPYALMNLEPRGILFIGAGIAVYGGMVIGENSRGGDLDVNPMKTKQLTNVRASGTDEAVRLTTPRPMTLEQAIAYIDDDELVEVTPGNIRLRKRYLDPHMRKRAGQEEGAT